MYSPAKTSNPASWLATRSRNLGKILVPDSVCEIILMTGLYEVVCHDGAEEDDEAVARDGDEPLGLAQDPRAPRLQVAPLAPPEVFEFLE